MTSFLQPSTFSLQPLVKLLAEDLLARSATDAAIDARLREAFAQFEKGGRTAQPFEVWRDDYLDQVAVAWVLACVFVRFMEDNHLIEECWLAGEGDRRKLAEGAHELFFRKHPHDTDREYFEHVFREVGKIPAAKELFAQGKTPLWALGPSGDAAMKLLAFWREIDPEEGHLLRSFDVKDGDTRFLGDLYQDLSEKARKKYALLQTPVFVEEFILDRTLTPALDEFGLETVRLIDPTCGSGHFLLGAFARLFRLWMNRENNEIVAAQKALDGVWGVDINPFAVAIARFRLIVAAVQACGIQRLKQAPAWTIHLAAGDSLLFGSKPDWQGQPMPLPSGVSLFEVEPIYAVEDREAVNQILGQGYHVVVGNPPYITVKDKSQNEAYRKLYSTCHRQYSLGVPFTQRFWELALQKDEGGRRKDENEQSPSGSSIGLHPSSIDHHPSSIDHHPSAFSLQPSSFPAGRRKDEGGQMENDEEKSPSGSSFIPHPSSLIPHPSSFIPHPSSFIPHPSAFSAGYVGMITANSFMKREFGKKLIEAFFPHRDLTHVVDTSGAYIPGHGTPTVILFGRNRKPVGETVRAVLGIKGEPSTPDDPSQGLVWQSIVKQIDQAGAQDEFTSTTDVPRTTFNAHPWSIGGGGASDLKEQLDSECKATLESLNYDIGFLVITGEDNCLVLEADVPNRADLKRVMPLVLGDELRDWTLSTTLICLWPNDQNGNRLKLEEIKDHLLYCWPYRVILQERKAFGVPVEKKGIPWWALRELYVDRLRTPLSIAFAFVATHNHFVLDRGGKVFNRSAPIIKLPAEATEDDHLALLGLLNSSTACFWMKQTFHNKGGQGINEGAKAEHWEKFYEHTGTGLQNFPLPEKRPLTLAKQLDELARQRSQCLPESSCRTGVPDAVGMESNRQRAADLLGQMIALQEELDWQCYEAYGLLKAEGGRMKDEENPSDSASRVPPLALGERAFEIVMARRGEKTAWFSRHGSTPITELPSHWPERYRKLVERRIELIETNKEIALIERPEYKRRWNTEPWEEQQQRALKNWLLDRLEFKAGGGKRKAESAAAQPSALSLQPSFTTTAQMADVASADAEFMQVAALYRGRPDFDVAALVAELVEGESVPFLPVLRYKATGLRKREVWERTWGLQRQQDEGGGMKDEGGGMKDEGGGHRKDEGGGMKDEGGGMKAEDKPSDSAFILPPSALNIPVPPKYASGDFQKTDYWRLRGKLDVPKERWISYPHCSTENDPSLVIAWAGWDHLEQATALIAYYDARKREGWTAQRLTPLLAGLDQLLPWIHQWHPEIDKEFGETAGKSFQTMLEHDAHELGLTLEEIRAWAPPAKGGRMKAEGGSKARTPRKKGETS